MNKCFIAGPLRLKEDFDNLRSIAADLRKAGFEVICPAEKELPAKEKASWVNKHIEDSDCLFAYMPKITFGTTTEVGMALALNKKVFILAIEEIYNQIKDHITVQGIENLKLIEYQLGQDIKPLIE